MLQGADYVQVHAARSETETTKADPVFWRRTWERANPSLPYMPELLKQIKKEADKARYDPAQLQSFKALRLNLGQPETTVSVLIDAALWQEFEAEKGMIGPLIFGALIWVQARLNPRRCLLFNSYWGSGCRLGFPRSTHAGRAGLA